MRKKYRLSYVFLQVFLPLFLTPLSSCFPENINFTSSKVTESIASNEEQQIVKQPYSEMFSEIENDRRIKQNNLIRKKRSLSSTNVVIKNYDKLLSQEENKLKSKKVQSSNSAGNNLFNKKTEKFKVQSDSSNKNPYVRRRRDRAYFQNMETAEDSSKRKNNEGLIRRRESDDNRGSVAESQKDSLSECSPVDDFDTGSQAEPEVNIKEEDTEEKRSKQENLNRSKRECLDLNPNVASAENSLLKREADYEDSDNQNDDDSNIQEDETEEDESENRNKSRIKRNEEDSDKDYEKELKSKADIERLKENRAVEKRKTGKETHLEKRQLKSETKRNTRQNQQIQKKNSKDLRDLRVLREETEDSEIEDLNLSKSKVDNQRLESKQKLQSDQKLETAQKLESNQNKRLESNERFDKESNQDSEMAGNLNLDVKENESEDDYEKRVADQIQQRIDAIKEEIKREVEEKQKIEEIEENNAKYDELQNQEDEDLSPNQDSSNQKIILERSLRKRNLDSGSSKRRIVRRRRRSNLANHQQSLKTNLEENKKMNSGYQKIQLRHESIRKRSAPEYGAVDANQDLNNKEKMSKTKASLDDKTIKKRTGILIPEQAQDNIEEKVPEDLVLDPKLGLNAASLNDNKIRLKRSNSRVSRRTNKRRRAGNLVRKGRLGYLRYRPQNLDDDNDDEGNEFEDDGFDDQTSNLDGGGSSSAGFNSRNEREDNQLNDSSNSSFDNRDNLTRRKRTQLAAARGSRKKRHQLKKRKRRKKTSAKVEERDKRGTGSAQKLSPRLVSDYKEAFGGRQGNPNEASARFKRIKRILRVT